MNQKQNLDSEGVQMIPIETDKGVFNIWTKKNGDNDKIKVLLLNGGPGMSHECFEIFEQYFPGKGIEFYYYAQLGSFNSDNPGISSLWNIERYTEEIEQVRKALNLNNNNFYLYGHSWGGILGLEYAVKYQSNLKGLILSNTTTNIISHVQHLDNVIKKEMPAEIVKEIEEIEKKEDYDNPKYLKLLGQHFYSKYMSTLKDSPDGLSRSIQNFNHNVYSTMWGPSEFCVTGNLKNWNRDSELSGLNIPCLFMTGKYDFMSSEKQKWASQQVQNGRFVECANGAHCSLWDEPDYYFQELISFIEWAENKQK